MISNAEFQSEVSPERTGSGEGQKEEVAGEIVVVSRESPGCDDGDGEDSAQAEDGTGTALRDELCPADGAGRAAIDEATPERSLSWRRGASPCDHLTGFDRRRFDRNRREAVHQGRTASDLAYRQSVQLRSPLLAI